MEVVLTIVALTLLSFLMRLIQVNLLFLKPSSMSNSNVMAFEDYYEADFTRVLTMRRPKNLIYI
jgi:hypothetical protein